MKRVRFFLVGLALLSAAPPPTAASDRVWVLWSQDDNILRGQVTTAHDVFPTLEGCHTARAQEQVRRQEEAKQDAARRQEAAQQQPQRGRPAAPQPQGEAPWQC